MCARSHKSYTRPSRFSRYTGDDLTDTSRIRIRTAVEETRQARELAIEQALERTDGNQSAAARLLHLTRDELRYRVDKFQLADE